MEAQTRWDVALTEVESLYRDVEKRSLSLPSFSLWPMVILLWNSFKFEFCLFLDSFLFVPVNAVIFLRNLFPGKGATAHSLGAIGHISFDGSGAERLQHHLPG